MLNHGYKATAQYWQQRKDATLPGWMEQIEKPGAQAWTLTYSVKEFEYKASGTYASFSDDEE